MPVPLQTPVRKVRISDKEVVDQLILHRTASNWGVKRRKAPGHVFVRVVYTPTGGQPGWHRVGGRA
ncbi:MAG TPA: hypothetical protein VF576_05590 [Rubricoccaceae bacterium]|jgi:hypothetical protein